MQVGRPLQVSVVKEETVCHLVCCNRTWNTGPKSQIMPVTSMYLQFTVLITLEHVARRHIHLTIVYDVIRSSIYAASVVGLNCGNVSVL